MSVAGWAGLPEELVPLRDEFIAAWTRTREQVASIHAQERETDPSLPEQWTAHKTCLLGWTLLMRSRANDEHFAALYEWSERT